MGKRLILVLMILFVFSITSVGYAETQTTKISGDLTMRGINHESLDLQAGNIHGSWFMSTLRLRLDAALSDDLNAVVRLLSERDWGLESTAPDSNDLDLDLAYITVNKLLFSPLTLTIGRQELRFGNAMIIGDPDTNLLASSESKITAIDLSARKSFDSIRATIDLAPVTIDPFFAQVNEGNSVNLDDDIYLYGINARYNFSKNNALSEIYYFVKHTDAILKDEVNNVGLRCSFGPNFAPNSAMLPFVLQAEVAHQFGDFPGGLPNGVWGLAPHLPGKRSAWAYDISGTLLTPIKVLPSITLLYNYRSGEDPADIAGNYTGWDIMYESQGGGSLDNALVAPSNAHLFHIITQIKPIKELTANIRFTHFIWDKAPLAGTPLFGVYGMYILTAEKTLGNFAELDLQYAYTEKITFGLNGGIYLAGNTFNEINDTNAHRIIASMKVDF